MSHDLKTKIIESYSDDPVWRRIKSILLGNDTYPDEDAIKLSFERATDGLIYYKRRMQDH